MTTPTYSQQPIYGASGLLGSLLSTSPTSYLSSMLTPNNLSAITGSAEEVTNTLAQNAYTQLGQWAQDLLSNPALSTNINTLMGGQGGATAFANTASANALSNAQNLLNQIDPQFANTLMNNLAASSGGVSGTSAGSGGVGSATPSNYLGSNAMMDLAKMLLPTGTSAYTSALVGYENPYETQATANAGLPAGLAGMIMQALTGIEGTGANTGLGMLASLGSSSIVPGSNQFIPSYNTGTNTSAYPTTNQLTGGTGMGGGQQWPTNTNNNPPTSTASTPPDNPAFQGWVFNGTDWTLPNTPGSTLGSPVTSGDSGSLISGFSGT